MSRASLEEVRVAVGGEQLRGSLLLPANMRGVVILALLSARSERASLLVRQLRACDLGSLRLPLLTPEEESRDAEASELRFDIRLLSQRILAQIDLVQSRLSSRLELGILATGTAAAGALVASARRPDVVRALVLQGGRPELAVFALAEVKAATLLVVGADDERCIHSNEIAALRLRAPHEVRVIDGAGHRFEEPGKLAEVAQLSASWFQSHLHQTASVPPAPAPFV